MIPVVTFGTLLLPLHADRPDTRTPGVIRGKITDAVTGQPVAAKLRVTNVFSGEAYFPEHSIKTMPQRAPVGVRHYFYACGSYEITVSPGRYHVECVRGITHDAVVQNAEIGSGNTHVHDFQILFLLHTQAAGWYSGNTHTHYHLEIDEDPDDRLCMVPPAEALDLSVISYLIRDDAPYITNRYPIGRLPQSRDGTIMDMGEEARNNTVKDAAGYGHCLFLNIPRPVIPASTGMLVGKPNAPDFPTLSMICEDARKIGGTTIWCHNGNDMETPVALALNLVNAYNVGDGRDADYQRYYRFLNFGFKIPASTGTDWWVYDHNGVFVHVDGAFTYDSWLAGLRAGRTYVSNGPLLDLHVNNAGPGGTAHAAETVQVSARAISRLPFDRLQIVQDGEVVAEQTAHQNRTARLETELPVTRSGWIAAGVESSAKTHALFTVFAHSSGVYVEVANTPARRAEAAGTIIDEFEASTRFIRKVYRFSSDADLAIALGRFEQARQVYINLLRNNQL